jgi:histidinol-phosphate aminotransferase
MVVKKYNISKTSVEAFFPAWAVLLELLGRFAIFCTIKSIRTSVRSVPSYIESLQPYKAGKPIDEVKRELGLRHVIKLASNENPLGASPCALDAMTRALHDLHLYPNGGYDLRVALAERYKLTIDNVITGSGSEAIMLNIIRTFLAPGDEVITTEAAFIGFQVLAHASGTAYRTVPYDNWRYDLPAIAKLVTDRTKLIYLANPNNPTGTMFTQAEFDTFYRSVPNDLLIILDEAYFEYACADPAYPDSLHYRYDNVITLRTFSKVYGLAGVRIGYGFAHPDLIGLMLKVKLPFEPGTLAQAAAIGALQDADFLRRSVDLNNSGREILFNGLTAMNLRPVRSAANFIMVAMRDEAEVNTIYQELLRQGVIVRPLKPFGLPACLRITVGTGEENAFFLGKLQNIISRATV